MSKSTDHMLNMLNDEVLRLKEINKSLENENALLRELGNLNKQLIQNLEDVVKTLKAQLKGL